MTEHDIPLDSELARQIIRCGYCFTLNMSHPWMITGWVLAMISDEKQRRYICHPNHSDPYCYIYDIESRKAVVKINQVYFLPYYVQHCTDKPGSRRYFFETQRSRQIISFVIDLE